jgi:hypothetical protein
MGTPMRRALVVCAAAIVVLTSRGAGAEPIAVPRLARGERGEVEATVVASVWSSANSVRAVHESSQLGARFAIADRVELGGAFALSYTRFSSDTEPPRSATRPSNLVVWGLVRLHEGERSSFHAGALVGAPLVLTPGGLPENPTARFGDRMTRAARGYDTPWLFADAAIPLALTLSATARPSPYVEVGGTLQPGALLSVNRNASRLALLTGAHVALVAGGVRVGVRGTMAVESVPIEGHDFAQVSLSPFVGVERKSVFLSVSTTFGVAGPYRVGNDLSTAWGGGLSVGVKM